MQILSAAQPLREAVRRKQPAQAGEATHIRTVHGGMQGEAIEIFFNSIHCKAVNRDRWLASSTSTIPVHEDRRTSRTAPWANRFDLQSAQRLLHLPQTLRAAFRDDGSCRLARRLCETEIC